MITLPEKHVAATAKKMKAMRVLFACGLALVAGAALSPRAQAALTDIANVPLSGTSVTAVKPNVFLMMDDSGSMSWTYMPDDANDFHGRPGYSSSQCNGVYYNPSLTYTPPVAATGASYPSQSFTAALYDGFNSSSSTVNLGSAFKNDFYSSTSMGGSSDTAQPAYYYNYYGSQTTSKLKDYYNTSSTFYTECNNSNTAATITINAVTASSSTPLTISGINVNGVTITSGSVSTTSTSTSGLASALAAKITANGFGATVSGSTITLTAPSGASYPAGYNPVISITSGSFSKTLVPFPLFTKVVVSSTSGPGGTDERTNFANWFSYYRSRLLMMKTATGQAFVSLDNGYRVGFATMNNNNGNMFVNIAPFDAAQKSSWYTKLYSSSANNSTPLLKALSRAGQLYGYKLPSNTLNGVAANDPMEYSCQQSFTILSTDGFWNDDTNYTLSGGSVDNQDSLEPRPYFDGATVTWGKSTSQIQQDQESVTKSTDQYLRQILQVQSSTSSVQKRTSSLQSSTGTLQKNTSSLQSSTGTLQRNTSPLQSRTGTLQKRTGSLQKRTSTNGGGSWSSWSNTTTCNPDSSGSGQTQCQYNWGSFATAASCTPSYSSGTSAWTISSGTDCQYSWGSYANAASCTPNEGTITQGVAVSPTTGTRCQYGAWSGFATAASCTPQAQGAITNGVAVSPATATQCQYSWGSFANAASCTPNEGSTTTNGVAVSPTTGTRCQYGSWSGFATAASCTPQAQGAITQGVAVSPATAAQCQYSWGAYANAASCTPNEGSTTTNGVAVTPTTGTRCQYGAWGGWSTSSCTPQAQGAITQGAAVSPATAAQCQYGGWSAWANATSCTPAAQGAITNNVAVTPTTATQCQTTDTGWVGVSSCTVGTTVSGGATTNCQHNTTGPTLVASCTNQTAGTGNNWLKITCVTSYIQNWTPVQACAPDPATAANTYISTNCKTVTTGPTNTTTCAAAAASVSNSWTTTTCAYVSSTGGTSNTLADVAEYYYKTDLRTSALGNATGALGSDVATNNVPTSGLDSAAWQHMTTFTLGLGARGRMVFEENYLSDQNGDYWAVAHNTHPNSATGVCSWQSTSATNYCNWPTPNSSGAPENIDDLWHAAVNGRGTYFSATDPGTLIAGLNSALAGMKARLGAGAAATTSNPNVTSGDNYVFNSSYTSMEWTGELVQSVLDLTTGQVVTNDPSAWAAQAQLDAKSSTSRSIYTFDSTSTTNGLMPFAWSSLTAAEKAYFTLPNIATLSQFCASGSTCLNTGDRVLAEGMNLVKYLAGDRSHEGSVSSAPSNTNYYRVRSHVLGDIVNAEAAYVKKPLYLYTDTGYSTFVANNQTRAGAVHVAANDGMLHAFATADGSESWAYVPALVQPTLYKLADENYANMHRFFADGTPVTGDAYFQAAWDAGPVWHTILVAGLNAGGRGYYALDVTDPASPKALWEFTDTNMGYTFGNPVIAKLIDGTWVVIVTSGYNNVSPGDGMGHLYVLNAATGALITDINTGVGSTSSPSGLSRISGWVENGTRDNTVLRVYGGDLNGNLWRFDVNNNIGATGFDAQLLVQLVDPSGNPQPITTRPELTTCSGQPVVLLGTGEYLGTTDLTNTQQQSFYAVRDHLDATTYGNPRVSGNKFVEQTETAGTCSSAQDAAKACLLGQNVRTGTSHAVDLSAGNDNGWYVDFLDTRERLNTDPTVVLGGVVFNTNVPTSSACSPSGYSYFNLLTSCTGAPSSANAGVATVQLANAISTRPVVVQLPNGTFRALSRLSDPAAGGGSSGTSSSGTSSSGTESTGFAPPGTAHSTRRVSWRELPTDQ